MLWAAGMGLASLALAVQPGLADVGGNTNAGINGVADLLEKGNLDGAKKAAKAVADKDDVETIMYGFKLRTKKGIGVGAQANVAAPDGIEAKIEALARDGITPAVLMKEKDALGRLGYVVAAVGHIAVAKAPEKDEGKAKKADWITWAQTMAKSGEEFSAVAKSGSPADIKKAANKIKQNCDSCHSVFK
jgi:hypothetical protein